MPPHEPYGGPFGRGNAPLRPVRRGGPGGLILLPVLLALLVGAVWLHTRLTGSPLWTVHAVSVEGNRSIATAELLDRLRFAPGVPWWRIAPGAAADLEKSEPRLASVSIRWQWPRGLAVRVREREGFLHVLSDPPLTVATDGMVLATEPDIDPVDLPLLTGACAMAATPNRPLAAGGTEKGWEEFLRLARESPELWRDVSEVHHLGGRDFRLYLRSGRQVILWETGVNDKLKQALPQVLSDLARQGQDDVVIDLRFKDQVVLRLPEGAREDSSAMGDAEPKAAIPGRVAAPRTGPVDDATEGRASAGNGQGRRRA